MIKDTRVRFGLIGVCILAIGVGIGRFSKPTEVVTEIKEKEVIRYVENKDEKKNVKIIKKKITNVDGSSTEIETIEDTSSSHSHVSLSKDTQKEFKQTTKNNIGLTISALVLARDLTVNEHEYGVSVSKRIFSNISVGAIVTEKRAVGLTIGLEF
jgi:hypothetical protein